MASSLSPKELASKAEEINQVLSEAEIDLWKLRELALSDGGLVDDSIRKKAWPKLVGLQGASRARSKPKQSEPRLPTNPPRPPSAKRVPNLPPRVPPASSNAPSSSSPVVSDSEEDASITSAVSASTTPAYQKPISLDVAQIDRDVARCTWHLLTGSQRAQRLQMELTKQKNKRVTKLIRRKQDRLANLINMTLVDSYGSDNTKLRYYQGYHDVACIFLSTLGGSTSSPAVSTEQTKGPNVKADLDMASSVLLQISQSHLKDCLKSNFMQLQTALRLTLFPLLAKCDREVHDKLYQCEMEPYFCLSWVITWFSHEIRDTELVKRLFDVFLVSHPLFPIYLSVAMILHPYNKREILECEDDFSLLHQTLTGLPKNSSMAGWKFRPGDGYVTDEEHDDGTVSTGTMDQSIDATDILLVERLTQHDDGETNSMVSSTLSSMEPPARVSFEVLIDDALDLLRRIPPRKLLGLASRYYGGAELQEMLDSSSSIQLLEDPPAWATAPSAQADWVLRKARRREREQGKNKSRRERRNERKRERSNSRSRRPSESGSMSEPATKQQDEDKANTVQQYLAEHSKSRAVIACGFGPGDDDERRRRKRRRLLMAGTFAVAALAVAVGVAMQYTATSRHSRLPTRPPPLSDIDARPEKPKRERVLETPIETKPSNVAKQAATPQDVSTPPKQSSRVINQSVETAPSIQGSTAPSQECSSAESGSSPRGMQDSRTRHPSSAPTVASTIEREHLPPTWQHYTAVMSAVERKTRHEAQKVHTQVSRAYFTSVEPHLRAAISVVSQEFSRALDSIGFGSRCQNVVDHSSRALEDARASVVVPHFRLLRSAIADVFDDLKASTVVRRVSAISSNSVRKMKETGWVVLKLKGQQAEPKEAVVQEKSKYSAIIHSVRETTARVKNSGAGRRLQSSVHSVVANPVVQKVFETTVAVALDASLLRFYG